MFMPTALPIVAPTAALEPVVDAAAGAAIDREPRPPGAPWLVITLFRRHDGDGSYSIALRRTDREGRR